MDLFGPFPKELLENGDQNIIRDNFDDEGRPKGIGPLGRPLLESEAFMPGFGMTAIGKNLVGRLLLWHWHPGD